MKMIGPEDNPVLTAKGNETSTLIKFTRELLESNIDKLKACREDIGGASVYLLEASRAALEFDNMLRSKTRRLDEDFVKDLMIQYLHMSSMYQRAGGHLIYKHHLMTHAIQKSHYMGNPRFYTTYRSESFNGVLARMARSVHSITFYKNIHYKASLLNARCLSQQMHP
jgi:hypothetical protein